MGWKYKIKSPQRIFFQSPSLCLPKYALNKTEMNSLMCRRENAKRSRGSFIVTTSKNIMFLCFLLQHNINLILHFSYRKEPFSTVTAKHLLSNGKTCYSELLCIYKTMWSYDHLHSRFWTTNSVRNTKKSADSI